MYTSVIQLSTFLSARHGNRIFKDEAISPASFSLKAKLTTWRISQSGLAVHSYFSKLILRAILQEIILSLTTALHNIDKPAMSRMFRDYSCFSIHRDAGPNVWIDH